MQILDKDIQTLVDAGLTSSQAKVYLTLVMIGKANGKTLWKNSGVARQDVYRILTELQRKRLIEKIIANPMEFKATSIEEGLSILLKNQAEKYKEVEEKIGQLLQKFKSCDQTNVFTDQFFILIPEKEAHGRKVADAFASAQKSIKTIMILNRQDPLDARYFPPLLKKAILRGVTVQQISNKPPNCQTLPENVVWKKKGSFELRYTDISPPSLILLVDDKEALFAIEPTPNPLSTSALWTNNPSLVTIAKTYFDLQWHTLGESKSIKTEKPVKQPKS